MLYLRVVLAIFPMFSWSINVTKTCPKTWVTAFDLPVHKVIDSMTTIHSRRPTRRNCKGMNMSDFETSSLCLDKKWKNGVFWIQTSRWYVRCNSVQVIPSLTVQAAELVFQMIPCRRFPYCPEAKF